MPVKLLSPVRLWAVLILCFGLAHQAFAFEVTDSLGTHQLKAIPKRAVVLDWDLIEQVIELGVTPVGVTNKSGYNTWVAKPLAPKQSVSVGTRYEPNFEAIAALKPDIILISEVQTDLKPLLERLAPVLVYTNFAKDQNHAQIAIKTFQQLATVFGKEQLAKQKLTKLHAHFKELREKLLKHFHGKLPQVCVIRFASTTAMFLPTDNAIISYVLQQIGLKGALTQPDARWGIIQKPITYLKNLHSGYVLYLRPFYQESALKKSVLWQALPVVQQHHVLPVRAVWNYGGAMSLKYMADAITDSLLKGAQS